MTEGTNHPGEDGDDSTGYWIGALKGGDATASEELWKRYFAPLVSRARALLASQPRAAYDEEDLALSTLNSVFDGAREGRFPDLRDRDDLWRLAIAIARYKRNRRSRMEAAQKRGGAGSDIHMSTLDLIRGDQESDGEPAFDPRDYREPTPEDAASLAESLPHLLKLLEANDPSGELGRIASLKLDGRSNSDIAVILGCVRSTVQLKLVRIRALWRREAPES